MVAAKLLTIALLKKVHVRQAALRKLQTITLTARGLEKSHAIESADPTRCDKSW